MPEFTEDYEIIGPKGKKEGNAFVDTGATYTVLPQGVADEVGVTPYKTQTVDTNNGPVQWGVGRADISIGGKAPREQDVFIAPDANPLAIGANSLQISGFKLRANAARARAAKVATCMDCPEMELHPYLGPKCTACGCLPPGDLVSVKTALPGVHCPLGKW
jgi:predicted aspartyl protease